jgi:hypothetical protein
VADSLLFSIPDGLDLGSPQICSLCRLKPAWLEYEINSDEPNFHQLSGSCCLVCGNNLLAGFEKMTQARNEESNPEMANSSAN